MPSGSWVVPSEVGSLGDTGGDVRDDGGEAKGQEGDPFGEGDGARLGG